jgi:hypothetical protein
MKNPPILYTNFIPKFKDLVFDKLQTADYILNLRKLVLN